MGYTHYWGFKLQKGQAKQTEVAYQKAIKECHKIVVAYYKEYGGLSGYTAHSTPGQYGGLNVNGKGEDGHETFSMREHFRQNLEPGNWNFCKTARKPYDLVVTACLIVLKHRLGDAFSVSSDGYKHEWIEGLQYARKVLKLKTIDIPKSIEVAEYSARLSLVK